MTTKTEFQVSNPEEIAALKLLNERDYKVYKKNCGEAVIAPESSEDLWVFVDTLRSYASQKFGVSDWADIRNLLRVIDALKRERDEAIQAVPPPNMRYVADNVDPLPETPRACTHPPGATSCNWCGWKAPTRKCGICGEPFPDVDGSFCVPCVLD